VDWGSLVGLFIALGGILIGQSLEGGHIASLLQPAAFVIVCCGTLGAVMLQTKLPTFLHGIKLAKTIFMIPEDNRKTLQRKLSAWGHIARKDGVLILENHLRIEQDVYLKKSLRHVIDGTPPNKLREIFAIDIENYELSERNAIRIWDAAGGYAPTVGILGAVLGLIHVMENLSDPNLLGSGIAVAFVATIYGVGLANLVFLPIANKLRMLLNIETTRREMILAGMMSIASGEHPQVIEERLQSYIR
jgi:chemotaxis protein MotA